MSSRIWLRRRTTAVVCGTTRRVWTLPFSSVVLLLDGVLDEVVVGGRLGDAGEERVLGERQVLEVLLPVALGGGGDAVAAVAVVVVVEVGLHDRLLAVVARVGLGQADRLDDLAQPCARTRRPRTRSSGRSRLRTSCWVIVEPPRSLPWRVSTAADSEGEGIEARVLPEGLVLDRRRGVHEDRRDLVEGHELAPVGAEACQQHLAGPVVDRGLLVVVDRSRGPSWGPAGPSTRYE